MEEYYPGWLGRGLIDENLPWDRAVEASMPAFLSEYTLHDSYWIGLHLQPNLETTAVIRWDTFWSRCRIAFPGPTVADWPILLIRFDRVYQIYHSYQERSETGWPSTTAIHGADSVPVPQDERQEMLDYLLSKPGPEKLAEFLLDDTLHNTTFVPIYGAQVNLLHGGATRFLCIGKEGKVLQIPDL